jgi:prevent-host-death family protein
MATVGSFDAKTHLAALLDRVEQGETIEITRRGRPVARLVPIDIAAKRDLREVARQMQDLSEGITLGGLNLRELIHEGHRY